MTSSQCSCPTIGENPPFIEVNTWVLQHWKAESFEMPSERMSWMTSFHDITQALASNWHGKAGNVLSMERIRLEFRRTIRVWEEHNAIWRHVCATSTSFFNMLLKLLFSQAKMNPFRKEHGRRHYWLPSEISNRLLVLLPQGFPNHWPGTSMQQGKEVLIWTIVLGRWIGNDRLCQQVNKGGPFLSFFRNEPAKNLLRGRFRGLVLKVRAEPAANH